MLSFLPFFQKDKLWKRNLNFLDMWHPGFQVCLRFVHSQGPRSSDKMIPPLSYCLPLSAHKASLQIGLYHPCQPCEGSCNLQMVTERKSHIKGGERWVLDPQSRHHCGKGTVFPFFRLSTLNQVANAGEGTKDHYFHASKLTLFQKYSKNRSQIILLIMFL